jgi:hypothetical protein
MRSIGEAVGFKLEVVGSVEDTDGRRSAGDGQERSDEAKMIGAETDNLSLTQ